MSFVLFLSLSLSLFVSSYVYLSFCFVFFLFFFFWFPPKFMKISQIITNFAVKKFLRFSRGGLPPARVPHKKALGPTRKCRKSMIIYKFLMIFHVFWVAPKASARSVVWGGFRTQGSWKFCGAAEDGSNFCFPVLSWLAPAWPKK